MVAPGLSSPFLFSVSLSRFHEALDKRYDSRPHGHILLDKAKFKLDKKIGIDPVNTDLSMKQPFAVHVSPRLNPQDTQFHSPCQSFSFPDRGKK